MKYRVIAVGAMLASALGLAACSSSSSDPNSSTAVPNAPRSASSLNQSSASNQERSASVPTRSLKSQLLTVSELPIGWADDNSSDNSDNSDAPRCVRNLKSTFHTSSRAERRFVKGTDIPTLQQSLGYFGASAAATYKAGAAILNRCKDVSFTSDGHRITGSIGALSFPKLGEQSAAWQLVLSTQGVTLGVHVVLVQKGSELTELLYGDVGTPDLAEVMSLARKAVAKMPAT